MIRLHKGSGHDLRPGETSGSNCLLCKREDDAGMTPVIIADPAEADEEGYLTEMFAEAASGPCPFS